ncbi:hypothetical protein NKH77_40570 [Streptomyces sp. M19]
MWFSGPFSHSWLGDNGLGWVVTFVVGAVCYALLRPLDRAVTTEAHRADRPTDLRTDPNADSSTDPSTDPSAGPTAGPSTDLNTGPSANPSAAPDTGPLTDPSANPSTDPVTPRTTA